jgi:hypothetical protein
VIDSDRSITTNVTHARGQQTQELDQSMISFTSQNRCPVKRIPTRRDWLACQGLSPPPGPPLSAKSISCACDGSVHAESRSTRLSVSSRALTCARSPKKGQFSAPRGFGNSSFATRLQSKWTIALL